MKRYRTLSRLFCGLTLLSLSGAAQARQAPPEDKSPGWAIILADDYKGESSPLYGVAQYDAVNWYRLLITKMKIQPDHIVLLAEGKPGSDFDQFIKTKKLLPNMNGDTPFKGAPVWADYAKDKGTNRVSKQLDWLFAQDAALKEPIVDFRNMFTMSDDVANVVPVTDAPTAHNFRSARDVISRLANEKQTLVVVVAAHAGSDPNLVMTKPAETDAASEGKISPEDALTAEDFALKGCKAGHRILIMDNSLRYFSENLPAAKEASAGRAFKTAFSGDKSLILLASDGTGISWPFATEGDAPNHPTLTGSAFLKSVAGIFESTNDYDFKSGAQEIKGAFDFGMSHLKHAHRLFDAPPVGYTKPAPLLYASESETKLSALFNPAAETLLGSPTDRVKTVSNSDITFGATGNPKTRMVTIHGVPIGEFSVARAEIIHTRFVKAMRNPLTVGNMKGIKVGERYGETVVLMPDNVKVIETIVAHKKKKNQVVDFFVTVDSEFARLMNFKSKADLGVKLSHDIRIALNSTTSATLDDNPSPQMQVAAGLALYAEGKFDKAADLFGKALEQQRNYPVAYVWLGRSMMKNGQADKARETFSELRGILEDHPEYKLEAQTEKELTALEAEVK